MNEEAPFIAEAKAALQSELLHDCAMADALRDLAHDARLRQAIVVTAVLKGGPMDVTHRDVFDSAAHDLDVRRTPTGYSVALKPAPN